MLKGIVRRLRRLSGSVSAEDMEGIQLEGPHWEVEGRHLDGPQFFSALQGLLPPGSTLFVEGGAHPDALREFLETHAVSSSTNIPRGTFWPRPTVFHLPAQPAILRGLQELTERCAEPEICDHLHVYLGRHVLLQWYDAFSDPIMVSKRIPFAAFRAFCETLAASWKDAEGA